LYLIIDNFRDSNYTVYWIRSIKIMQMDDAGTIDDIGTLYERSSLRKEDIIKAASLNRIIAKIVDFVIVMALLEIVPGMGFFAGLAYLILADGLFKGRSIGKKLMGLRVSICDESDYEIAECRYQESVYRNFSFAIGYLLAGILWNIPVLGAVLSIVIIAAVLIFESLIMIGSENSRRLGDEMAKTRVVVDK
jgi:hypothetical protein